MVNYGADYWNLKPVGLYQTIFYSVGVAPLALCYTGIMILLFQHNTWKKLLSVTAPVGKMAFTNYVMHTLVGTCFFSGVGLNLAGKLGTFFLVVFALNVFICQIIISTIWLKYFNYGPIEWLWRSATFKKWQKFVKS